MTQRPNIAQIEFFHVKLDSGTTQEFLSDISERIAEGSKIKTVVRILDEGGFITELVLALRRTQDRREKLLEMMLDCGTWWRPWLNFRFQKLGKKEEKLKKQALLVSVRQLDAAVHTSSQIAIELPDHRFRLAKPNEMHELLETARKATGVWLFVFKPNDLLADENTYVVYAM
jgi:hypothetical protein